MVRHVMETETEFDHGWMTQCPDCPRRIFFDREGGLTLIDRGDFYALHVWSNTPELSVHLEAVDD